MRWADERYAQQLRDERQKQAAQRQRVRVAMGARSPVPLDLMFSNRNFALLWWGGLFSMIGNWALQIGLPVYVYETTGSTLATGLMFMAGTVPSILLSSVAGIFVDRWDRRRTMIVTNLLLFVGVLPLVFAPLTGWLWLIYLVAFIQAVTSRFFVPAENALLPAVVEKGQLTSANALNALNDNLARLIGPALGGLVMGLVGLQGVVILNAVTFLVAAGLIALVALKPQPTPKADSNSPEIVSGLRGVWEEWLEGIMLIKRDQVVTVLFVITAIASLGEGVMITLFVPFVTDVLQGEAIDVGWLMSAQAIGGIVGGVVISGFADRIVPYRLLGWGAVGLGVIDLAIFNYPFFLPGIAPALVLIAFAGLPVSGYQAGLLTLFQLNVDDKFRGRIFGTFGTTMALLNLFGIGAAAILGDSLGVALVINTQAVAYLVAGTVGLIFLGRLVAQRPLAIRDLT